MIIASGSMIDAFRRICGVTAIALGVMLASIFPAQAQQINPLDVHQDPNGVDLLRLEVAPQLPSISIPAAPELAFKNLSDFMPILEGKIVPQSPTGEIQFSINAGGIASESFECFDGAGDCVGKKGSGSVLYGGGNVGPYYYTQGGTGKLITFDIHYGWQSTPTDETGPFYYVATFIMNPGGPALEFTYDSGNPYPGQNVTSFRPATVTSTSGYRLKFTYHSNDPTTGTWRFLQKVEIVRVAEPNTPLASLEYSLTINSTTTVEDIGGRQYVCQPCGNELNGPNSSTFVSLTLPGATSPSVQSSATHTGPTGARDRLLTITRDGVTYTYDGTHDPSHPGYDYVDITAPNGFDRHVEITNTNSGRRRIDSVTDSQNNTTSYLYDSSQRVTQITYPEGNKVNVTYDISGNITSLTTTPKNGSPEAALGETLSQQASYNSGLFCDTVSCFRPVWTRDAMGRQTDYTWGQYSGLLLTQLDPPDENNIRRKTKNTYDGAGRLTRTEICEADVNGNELTCGTAASFATEYTYFAGTRLPETESVTDGLGNNPLTTTYTYDEAGRQVSSDGPLPGSEDATYAIFDVLEPDPKLS